MLKDLHIFQCKAFFCFIALFSLTNVLAVPPDCVLQICGHGNGFIGDCPPELPPPCNGTFHPSDDPTNPPDEDCIYYPGYVGEQKGGLCEGRDVSMCCVKPHPRGFCCPLNGGGVRPTRSPSPNPSVQPSPSVRPTSTSQGPVKRCVLGQDQWGFVGVCMPGVSRGKICNSDTDCRVGRCITLSSGAYRCERRYGGTGLRPCVSDEECGDKYCKAFHDQKTGLPRMVCALNGNTFWHCKDDRDCQGLRCDRVIPKGTNIAYPICVSGGLGSKCSSPEDCKKGSECVFYISISGDSTSECLPSSNNQNQCRNDSDCKLRIFRCHEDGRCTINGTGIPCSSYLECLERKYCRVSDGTAQCVAGRLANTLVQCAEDKDCEGLGKKRCIVERERAENGPVTYKYKCEENGVGTLCRTADDCRQRLPSTCAVVDGVFRCLDSGPIDGPICKDDYNCSKYKKVCRMQGNTYRCVENNNPRHTDFPCETDADCTYTRCSKDGKCEIVDGIGYSECRTDADCRRNQETPEETPGAVGADQHGQIDVTHRIAMDSGREAGLSNQLSSSDIVEGSDVKRGSLSELMIDESVKQNVQRLVETVKRHKLPINLYRNKTPDAYLVSFNDVNCGMSRKLISTFAESGKSNIDILLIPVILGGGKEDYESAILQFACFSKVYADYKHFASKVSHLFSKEHGDAPLMDRALASFENEKQKVNFEKCINDPNIARLAGELAEIVARLRVTGTPTSYVLGRGRKSDVFVDYSGYRDNFWHGFPIEVKPKS